jgi:hypothetical protein
LLGSTNQGHRPYDLKPTLAQFQPQARSAIHLFMNDQVELSDPKATLSKFAGSATQALRIKDSVS